MPNISSDSTKNPQQASEATALQLDLTAIHPQIPKIVKKFDPSYVTRYVIISELVKSIRQKAGGEPLRILDVGGYNGAARSLLPNQDITIIDLFKDNKLKKYISYDGGVMPFKDNEFDMVISCDTLEHVPHENRQLFLSEAARVTSNFLLLCAPFGAPEVVSAELRSDIFYQGLTGGESYIWLKEHREYGLPSRSEFTSVMSAAGFYQTNFDHTSLDLWEIMLRSSFFLAGNYKPIAPEISARLEKANDAYLKNYTFSDFPTNGYRTFFVCSKKYLPTVKLPAYDPSKTADFVVQQLKLTGECISEFSKEFGKTHDQLIALRQESQKLYRDSLNILHERDVLNERLAKIYRNKAFRIAKKARDIKRHIIKT